MHVRVVKCIRGIGRLEQCRSSSTLEDESPLIARGMPVNLPHGTGLDRYECGRDHVGDGEGERVEDLYATTGDLEWLLLGEVVRISAVLGDQAIRVRYGLVLDVGRRLRAREDEELAWWDIREC